MQNQYQLINHEVTKQWECFLCETQSAARKLSSLIFIRSAFSSVFVSRTRKQRQSPSKETTDGAHGSLGATPIAAIV